MENTLRRLNGNMEIKKLEKYLIKKEKIDMLSSLKKVNKKASISRSLKI